MTRTAGSFFSDGAHNGGWLFYGGPQLISSSPNLAVVRNAQFDWSLNRVAAGAETYQVVWNSANLRRVIESYLAEGTFQEQFNMGAPLPGRPPFAGVTEITPPGAAGPSKGLQIDNVVVIYQNGVVNLTAASLAAAKAVYADSVAPVFTAIPIDATALSLVAQATPHVMIRAVTTPIFTIDDLSDLEVEFAFTMANTGTMRVYGIGVHCHFNYD